MRKVIYFIIGLSLGYLFANYSFFDQEAYLFSSSRFEK